MDRKNFIGLIAATAICSMAPGRSVAAAACSYHPANGKRIRNTGS